MLSTMPLIVTTLFVIVLIIFALCIICSKVALERLLQTEYERYPEAWRADGCPRMEGVPRISRLACAETGQPGGIKTWANRLLTRTPTWVATEPECRRWLRAYRISFVVFIVSLVGSLLGTIAL